jgi:16S rRNA (guanine527-N7)-methyltransferase
VTGGTEPSLDPAPSAPGRDATPEAARQAFGGRVGLAERYRALLAGPGIERGLLGPREAPRLWTRHLLNSAVLADFVAQGERVVDVGSGAGLPGLPMAIRRPDLGVDLVEPTQRRTEFLGEAVAALGLGTVRVVRGRAEDAAVREQVGNSHWVVARAVAPLDRLVRWCLPLLADGGWLLALKGSSAADEMAEHRSALRKAGARELRVERAEAGWLDEPTWVVMVQRGTA